MLIDAAERSAALDFPALEVSLSEIVYKHAITGHVMLKSILWFRFNHKMEISHSLPLQNVLIKRLHQKTLLAMEGKKYESPAIRFMTLWRLHRKKHDEELWMKFICEISNYANWFLLSHKCHRLGPGDEEIPIEMCPSSSHTCPMAI